MTHACVSTLVRFWLFTLLVVSGATITSVVSAQTKSARFTLEARRDSVSVSAVGQTNVHLELVPNSYRVVEPKGLLRRMWRKIVGPRGVYSGFLLRIRNNSDHPICSSSIGIMRFELPDRPGLVPPVAIEGSSDGQTGLGATLSYGGTTCPSPFLEARGATGAKPWRVFTTKEFQPYRLTLELRYQITPDSATRTTLTLQEASQNRVAGVFVSSGVGIRFEVAKPSSSSDPWRVKLLTLDNSPLLVEEIEEDTTRPGKVSILADRLVVRRLMGGGDVKGRLAETGDPSTISRLLAMPEFRLLPDLSRELGTKHGIQGNVYRVSIPLHLLASRVAMATNYGSCGDPRAAEREIVASRTPGNRSIPSVSCDCDDAAACPCGGTCFGMCGNGCSCASWVCGDCCRYKGCTAHDRECRECAINNLDLSACTACTTFVDLLGVGACDRETSACSPEAGNGGPLSGADPQYGYNPTTVRMK